jgi:3-oxoacyl-[acyl-carrier-protein] synthase II
MRRVVITGMGMVTPLGMGVDHNWDQITNGKSGIKAVDKFDIGDIPSKIAGIIPTCEEPNNNGLFHAASYVDTKEQKKMDEFIVFGMAAAQEAIEDSGYVAETEEQQWRTGVLIGSGIGGLETIYKTSLLMEEKGTRRISPFFIPSALINLCSGHVSIKYGFKGPNHSVVTACATGTHAIGDAARLIMFGDADVMVAGGAESSVNKIGMAGFAAARALSTEHNDNPEGASRPFDEGRDGFVIAEGAGIVVLEEYEHAKARGAKIYGEVTGYGLSGDANHITAPAEDGNGGFRAMQAAMRNGKVNPEDIGYVNAHGTSTPVGDGIEAGAVKRMFANSLDTLSMSSTKSAIGHLLGAAGAVEAIYTAKALQTGILPPTLNLDNPSEVCQGMDLVPHVAKEKNITCALSNSFGFGGTNASLILTKV